MKGYALAHLRNTPTTHPDVFEYMEKIQSTLEPFSGRFIIHGGTTDVVEGNWDGNLIMIEFPSLEQARSWYRSAEYQAIIPLRRDHLPGEVILVEGVKPGHDPAELAAQLRLLSS